MITALANYLSDYIDMPSPRIQGVLTRFTQDDKPVVGTKEATTLVQAQESALYEALALAREAAGDTASSFFAALAKSRTLLTELVTTWTIKVTEWEVRKRQAIAEAVRRAKEAAKEAAAEAASRLKNLLPELPTGDFVVPIVLGLGLLVLVARGRSRQGSRKK